MIEYKVKVTNNGDKYWYFNCLLHREDGPAKEYANGNKEWWLFNQRHREDGPAVEYATGDKYWYKNGKCHREDGPAAEHADGNKEWWINDKLHREDGPACEYANGGKYWYINGKELTEEEFKNRNNSSCNGKIVKLTRRDDCDGYSDVEVVIDGVAEFSVNYDPDCPEDNTLDRNFNDCNNIISLLEKVYKAGKNGDTVTFDAENIGVVGELVSYG